MDVVIALLPRALLALTALAFIGLGLVGLANPVGTVAPLDIAVDTGLAKTELRATYGGLMFGIGLVFVYAAIIDNAQRFGLWAIILILLTIGVSRAMGMVIDGTQATLQWQLLASEIGFSLLAVLLLLFHPTVNGKL